MTSDAGPRNRILGTLRSADSAGVVRIEDRYETTIDDLWQAVTDPDRLARWYGQVGGDELSLGPLAGPRRAHQYQPHLHRLASVRTRNARRTSPPAPRPHYRRNPS